MFSDPISITVDSTPVSLPRVATEGQSATYKSADETYGLKISHQTSKNRTRRMVRLDSFLVAADPLTSVNAYQQSAVYLVIDHPTYGLPDATVMDGVNALLDLLGTAGVLDKVMGGES